MRQRILAVISSRVLWQVLPYAALALVVVWLYTVSRNATDAKVRAAKLEAVRIAEKHATSKGKVQQCMASIPNLEKVNRFVHGVQILHEVLTENAYATLRSTPRDDPQYRVRLANYRRVKVTVPAVKAVKFTVPTRHECLRRGTP